MEVLLRNNYTAHYGIPTSITPNISLVTSELYFEIEDDIFGEIQLHLTSGNGVAAYRNNNYEVKIINYDKFVTGLPQVFETGKERCDLIVYTHVVEKYFLLNELTDTDPKYVNPYLRGLKLQPGKRAKAISQLLNSLIYLMDVPAIKAFIVNYEIRRCCFFNKKASAPLLISAASAFNRINTISEDGFKMLNKDIENLGFELYEFEGGKVFNMS